MSETKPLIDPQELATIAKGFVVGLLILGFFFLLMKTLGNPLLAETWMLPRQ